VKREGKVGERTRASTGSGPTLVRGLSAGRPLEGSVASRMGHALGHSFADVRIHDGPEAADLVSRHSAIATTIGSNIAFAPGAYRPGTDVGDALLAHELAHVQQQRGGRSDGEALRTVGGPAHEADAHEAAVTSIAQLRGLRGVRRTGATRQTALGIQRCGLPAWAPPMPAGSLTPSNARAFVTGAQADTMLKNSPTVGPYVKERIEVGPKRCVGARVPQRSQGNVLFHPNAEFQQAQLNYLARVENPDAQRCDKTYTESEAKAEPTYLGFQDAGKLHLNEDTAFETDTIHEALHRYQDDSFTDELGFAAQEGTTEYLAEKVLTEQTPPKPFNVGGYGQQTNAIKTMVETGGIGTPPLCEAYFKGDVGALRAAVDKDHPGRLAQWVGFMKRRNPDYAAANALFP
jgi:hypothetical protein